MLWRLNEATAGEDKLVFKLHYSRAGKLKLTGIFPATAEMVTPLHPACENPNSSLGTGHA